MRMSAGEICLDLLKEGVMNFSAHRPLAVKNEEIDLVALDDESKTIWFGECKWSTKQGRRGHLPGPAAQAPNWWIGAAGNGRNGSSFSAGMVLPSARDGPAKQDGGRGWWRGEELVR